jgi:hypothetical protein
MVAREGARGALGLAGGGLGVTEHPHRVVPRQLAQVRVRPAPVGQLLQQRRVAVDPAQPVGGGHDAVVVAADADVVHPGHVPDVLHVVGDIADITRRPRVRLQPPLLAFVVVGAVVVAPFR